MGRAPGEDNIWMTLEGQQVLREVLPQFPGIEETLRRLIHELSAPRLFSYVGWRDWAKDQTCMLCQRAFDDTGGVLAEAGLARAWVCGDCIAEELSIREEREA